MKDIALSKILDELKWSRVEKYKKLAATSESKRLNSMTYYEIKLTKITVFPHIRPSLELCPHF